MSVSPGNKGGEGDINRLDRLMLNSPKEVTKAKETGKILGNTHAKTDSLLSGLEMGLNQPVQAAKKPKKSGEKQVQSGAEEVKDSQESAEKPKYNKIEYKDEVTGYKVTVYVPEGQKFDPKKGKVSFYFPGDGAGNGALEVGKPGKKLLDKLPNGVYAVVAGGAKSGSEKYARFDKSGQAWDSLVKGVGQQLGVKDGEPITTEMLAHSRGGGALNRLLAAGKVMPSKVVVLDTCHEPLQSVMKYIERGGKVDFCYADSRTVESAANFQNTLENQYGVKFIRNSDGSFVSANGHVKIFPRFNGGHGAVFASYLKAVGDEPASMVAGSKTPVTNETSTVASTEVSSFDGKVASSRSSSRGYRESSGVRHNERSQPTSIEARYENLPMADKALQQIFAELTRSSELEPYRIKGKCEQYSDNLRQILGERLVGQGFKFDFGLNFNAPILADVTDRLRGKKTADAEPEDFAGMPIGATIFVNDPSVYPEEEKPRPGTHSPISKVAGARHWFTLIGRNLDGGPIFADNGGDAVDLATMKSYIGGKNRVFLTVYDPYVDLRQGLTVDVAGNVSFDKSRLPDKYQVA